MDLIKHLTIAYSILIILLVLLIGIYVFADFEEVEKPTSVTYYITEQGPQTVVMGEEAQPAVDPFQRRREVLAIEAEEEELQRCIETLSSKWERNIDGQFYEGYNEELDAQWVQDLRMRLMLGEDIC